MYLVNPDEPDCIKTGTVVASIQSGLESRQWVSRRSEQKLGGSRADYCGEPTPP